MDADKTHDGDGEAVREGDAAALFEIDFFLLACDEFPGGDQYVPIPTAEFVDEGYVAGWRARLVLGKDFAELRLFVGGQSFDLFQDFLERGRHGCTNSIVGPVGASGAAATYTQGMVAQERISKTPGVCGGKACIAGHRVRVMDIAVWHEHQGMSADEIVTHVPSITLADVHAALAYYFDHRDEIQEEIRDAQEAVRRLRGEHPSLLDHRLSQARIEEAS